ncbi:MAG: GTP pyrophosphokinase family protein [Fusicatenibacter sp.]|nr:GTP pyrophosphokinase family protein [Fusicatenibacter sp.]
MDILLWHEILEPYDLAVKELTVKFNHLIKEHHEKGLYSPIESVCGRVKSVSSILEKMQRKGISPDDMEEQVEDIAGIRIICQFVEDIEKVAELISKRSDIVIKSEKDYIKHMKDSGYRSYHLIVYYTVETMNGPKRLQAEIQIRTMAMDFWATIEHSLQYKYKANIPEHIRDRLEAAARAIISLDNEMSSVRSEIMDAQNSSQIQRNLITDILNNIENLYKLSNKREVEKIQDEFYHIYALNDLQELKRFHKELDLIAEGYRAQAITDEM